MDAVDQAKRTALFYAARANRPQAMAKLAQAGAKLDAIDSQDYTRARRRAERRRRPGRHAIALAGRKSSGRARRPAEQTWANSTPLVPATCTVAGRWWRWRSRATMRPMCARYSPTAPIRTAAPVRATRCCTSRLHVGSEGTLKVLLAAHANPKLADKRGRTVLVLAATRGELGLVNALLARPGERPTRTPPESRHRCWRPFEPVTPRSPRACWPRAPRSTLSTSTARPRCLPPPPRGNAALVKLLLANGASARLADQRGETPLWRAAHAGAVDAAHLLLDGRCRRGRGRPRRAYAVDVRDRRGP